MARIYSHDGYVAADGLQGCETCDEALQLACRIADEWDEAVELEDDDGTWRVHPVGDDGVRELADRIAEAPRHGVIEWDDEPDDYAVCHTCGQHAVHHGAPCHE